jgi:hypothetical protein
MNVDVSELFKRTSITLIVLGTLLFLIAAIGGIPFAGTNGAIESGWRITLAILGGILLLIGIVVILREEKSAGAISKTTIPEAVSVALVPPRKSELSGFVNAFRIPLENASRGERVKQMIAHEAKRLGTVRLVASSGYSYLNHNGQVWNDAKLGDLLINGSLKMQAILESPFADFATTRALANQLDSHQWQEKQKVENLIELLRYPNVTLRVTEIPVNCSLFFTSKEVFYDPYLWPKRVGKRTENNFWVFEFIHAEDPEFDCYALLERHFDFCLENSVPLEDFLYTPQEGEKKLFGLDFYQAYKSDPDKYLDSYLSRSNEFKTKMRKLLGWTTK